MTIKEMSYRFTELYLQHIMSVVRIADSAIRFDPRVINRVNETRMELSTTEDEIIWNISKQLFDE